MLNTFLISSSFKNKSVNIFFQKQSLDGEKCGEKVKGGDHTLEIFTLEFLNVSVILNWKKAIDYYFR